MKKILCSLFLIFYYSVTFSQESNKQFTVKYISEPITTDGVLDEPIWGFADDVTNFWQNFPTDSLQAEQQVVVKILFDDENLYIGSKVNAIGKNYTIPSLKRDYRGRGSDGLSFLFDTFNDGTNAYMFGINPYGVRKEAQISGGGTNLRGFNASWDTKWKGESKIYDTYYTSEIIIPLTAFKFKEGETKWRFNSYSFDTQSNERSSWAKVPQNQFLISLAFMGDMVFEKPLGKPRTPLSIIPYINTIAQKDFDEDQSDQNFKVGGDAKIAIGNSMNLDVTVNPDFSQVEVDNQVTNLTRFEVSLPEKRQFFIDNSDLFSSFGGFRDANPFFSRRIGIAKDTAGNSIENKILGGVRLSGKLNEDWRLGFLNLQTEGDEANEIASNNNTVFALQKKVFSRSNIGMFFINRESFKDYDFVDDEDRYNRVLGIDYNLASADGKWQGKTYMHKSFQHNGGNKDLSTGLFLNYNTRHYNIITDLTYLGDDFRSDLGFIRRTDIVKFVTGIERIFWPTKGSLNRHSFQIFPVMIWKPELDYKNTDFNIIGSWESRFNNQSRLDFRVFKRYTYLTSSFDPTSTDGALELPEDVGYHYTNFSMEYSSDNRKALSYTVSPSAGSFFNGERYSFEGTLNLRFQPKVSLSMALNYDKIMLPDPYPSADIWLISPKIDVTFSKSVFWSTLVQYSNQRDNLGFNSRLQWRFAPLSDLYLVYNDNYYVNSFSPKTRSINLKFTYWLNI